MYSKDELLNKAHVQLIEIAKEYSGEKSHIFINGVLNRIVQDLTRLRNG